MTTTTRKTETATIQVQGVKQDDRRVTLTAIPLLKNNEWGKFPASYYVWHDSAPEAYQRAALLKETHIVQITYFETPNKDGKGAFRNVLTIDRPDLPNEPKSPVPAVQPPNEESEALWNEMGAQAQKPQGAPTVTKAAPHDQKPLSTPRQWSEAYSQGKEAFIAGRVSYEAQHALTIAGQLMENFLTTVEGDSEKKMRLVENYLPRLTISAANALNDVTTLIQEAKQAEGE